MPLDRTLLQARGITKRFAGNLVLDEIDFNLAAGTVHVLMGENGAGKSTLIKILSGIHRSDAGEIAVDHRPVCFQTPKDAITAGIRVVHQEFSLVPALSVAENIHLGALPNRVPGGLHVDRSAMRKAAGEALDLLGANIDPEARVENLSVAERQLVEIARALRGEAKILILDEPTAALSAHEVQRLLGTIQRLRTSGLGIIYISHRMEEVRQVGDDVSVLRDGKLILRARIDGIGDAELIEAMIGRKLGQQYPARAQAIGAPLLKVDALSSGSAFQSVSLALARGEVLGVVGPVGSGFIELGQALFGMRAVTGGRIHMDDRPVRNRTPRQAIDAGFAFVPEDRKQTGLMGRSTVLMNASAAILQRLTPLGRPIDRRRERAEVSGMVERLGVAGPGLDAPVSLLSGGNQQKVVLGRWLLHGAKVFILAEPTRGVDVGAKEMIYAQINALAEAGAGVLVLTSDLMEAVGMCDRLVVMRLGRVVRELSGPSLTLNDTLTALYSEAVHDRCA